MRLGVTAGVVAVPGVPPFGTAPAVVMPLEVPAGCVGSTTV